MRRVTWEADEGDALRRIDALVESLPAADEPYWVAVEIMGVASEALVTSIRACQHYEIWAALTDRYELKSDERPQAVAAIRRAAAEWLGVKDDPVASDEYFDQWLYEILGYRRTVPKGWILVVEELSAGVYRVHAEDRHGRSVTRKGTDLETLKHEVGQQAFALEAAA